MLNRTKYATTKIINLNFIIQNIEFESKPHPNREKCEIH
jgi:hypothetical protein